MDKLAMISVLIATVAVPITAARGATEEHVHRALRRALVLMLLTVALYVAYVSQIHARFQIPETW